MYLFDPSIHGQHIFHAAMDVLGAKQNANYQGSDYIKPRTYAKNSNPQDEWNLFL